MALPEVSARFSSHAALTKTFVQRAMRPIKALSQLSQPLLRPLINHRVDLGRNDPLRRQLRHWLRWVALAFQHLHFSFGFDVWELRTYNIIEDIRRAHSPCP